MPRQAVRHSQKIKEKKRNEQSHWMRVQLDLGNGKLCKKLQLEKGSGDREECIMY